MKYIILEDEDGGKWPFIFPESAVHAEVASRMKHMLGLVHKSGCDVYSAGFIDPTFRKTHGVSETLGVKSNPSDIAYIILGESVKYMPPNAAMIILKKMGIESPRTPL